MRLTKREKILIIVLLFTLAGYLLFQYVITPQLAQLSSLKANVENWKEKKQALSVIDDTIAKYDQQKEELDTKIQTIGNSYFSSLDMQEESIIVLNDLLLNTGLKDADISFDELADGNSSANAGQSQASQSQASQSQTDQAQASQSQTGQAQTGPIRVQNVQLSFEGSYQAVWNELRAIWNFKKAIHVDSLSMSQSDASTEPLTGEIDLSFYDLSKITDVSDAMVKWSDSGQFRQQDPFAALSGAVFPGTRYTLDLNDENTEKYVKFVDIEGNWAESEIDDLGRRHVITGDSANRFLPDDPITRGEFIMMLDKFYQWDAPDNTIDLTQFSDYSELGQSLTAVEKAFYKGYMRGIFIGYGDGTLRPNAPTTYEEFELVMRRILNQPDFKWDDTALAIQQKTGYTSPGLTDKTASMTRAEVVYFLDSQPQT